MRALVAAAALLLSSAGSAVAGPLAAAAATPEADPWRRWVLNALLVPLLEPDGAPTWAWPTEAWPCVDNADVRVDGRPLRAGELLPIGRPLRLTFRLDDCWPLGGSWIGLGGTLEMTVVHTGPRLEVEVRPIRLTGNVQGVRVPVLGAFAATLALDPAKFRP